MDVRIAYRNRMLPLAGPVIMAVALVAGLDSCNSKQDAAVQQAKQQAAKTGQPQTVVETDKSGNTVTTVVQPPAPGQKDGAVTTTVTPKAAAATPGAPATTAAQSSTAEPPPPPPLAPIPVEVPAGTALTIRINQRISAKESYTGQKFTGVVAEPVTDANSKELIAKGSTVAGKVVLAKGRGNFKGAADLELRLTSLTLNGQTYPLETRAVLRTMKGKGKRTAGFVGGGAGLGLILGGIAGGGRGAAIGGLAGAGAGTIGAGATGNKDLVIPAESIVHFRLKDDLTIQPGS
jgi:hypothetical protein